jgi:hypothetical protein
MLYLESYDNFSSASVDVNEFQDKMDNTKSEIFTQSEISEIESWLRDSRSNDKILDLMPASDHADRIKITINDFDNAYLTIYKRSDEWYLVHYRCMRSIISTKIGISFLYKIVDSFQDLKRGLSFLLGKPTNESFFPFMNAEKLYSIISQVEWIKSIRKETSSSINPYTKVEYILQKFSNSEKEYIKAFLDSETTEKITYEESYYSNDAEDASIKIGSYHVINIYKTTDDWFFIRKDYFWPGVRSTYYKCDQLDGVIDCIKYLLGSIGGAGYTKFMN